MLSIETGSNKSLFTLIAVVVFGIFLSLSYWLFQDEMTGVLGSVVDGTSEVASGFFNDNGNEETPVLGYYRDPNLVPNPSSDFTFDPATGTILKYIGSSPTVVIPYEIDGVSVTSIGEKAFYDTTNVTNVTNVEFPSTVKSIGYMAFHKTRLVTVTLPDSIEVLEDSAFRSIPTLTTVKTGKGLKTIGHSTFKNTGLTIIDLNEGLLSIGTNAFYETKLELLTLPSTVTTLGWYIIASTPTLKDIIIPKSLESSVKSDSFSSVVVKKTYYDGLLVTTRGDYILTNKGVLIRYLGSESNINIPSSILGFSVTSIGASAFSSNTNVTNVEFPSTITSIGASAFYGTRLVTVTLPDSIEVLEGSAFRSIPTLTTVKMGKGLKTIGSSTFNNTGLTSIDLNEGLLSIGTNAFYETKLVLLTLPSTVTTLGRYIIASTPTLKEILIPESLKSSVKSDSFSGEVVKKTYY